MFDERFCKMYVNGSVRLTELLDHIQSHTAGIRGAYHVDCEWGLIDAGENDEYQPSKVTASDGFLYYRFILDIECVPAVSDTSQFVTGLAGLVKYLKARGFSVVPACAFEDQLLDR